MVIVLIDDDDDVGLKKRDGLVGGGALNLLKIVCQLIRLCGVSCLNNDTGEKKNSERDELHLGNRVNVNLSHCRLRIASVPLVAVFLLFLGSLSCEDGVLLLWLC